MTDEEYYEMLKSERIADDTIGGVRVSTVITFSGFTESRVGETMIFLNGGEVAGLKDADGERCPIWEVKEMHARWVMKVAKAVYA